MPLFKKPVSDANCLTVSHRKVLRRCRMILIKDLDIQEILDYMSLEDVFKPDVKETILGQITREQRVGVFLDKLETKGDRAFLLFMEALKENYKHLHYVLDETLRNIDEIHESQHRDRVAITGETVRKVLHTNLKRKAAQSQGSESADDLDVYFEDRDDADYIDCYAIPMRGRLQKEKWIKHMSVPKRPPTEAEEVVAEKTFMGVLTQELCFKRIQQEDIPSGIKMPPKYCRAFVVHPADEDDEESSSAADEENNSPAENQGEDPAEADGSGGSMPPPVPPKPENLPSIGLQPPVLKKSNKKKEQSQKNELLTQQDSTKKSDKPPSYPARGSRMGLSIPTKPPPLPRPNDVLNKRLDIKDDLDTPPHSPPLPPRPLKNGFLPQHADKAHREPSQESEISFSGDERSRETESKSSETSSRASRELETVNEVSAEDSVAMGEEEYEAITPHSVTKPGMKHRDSSTSSDATARSSRESTPSERTDMKGFRDRRSSPGSDSELDMPVEGEKIGGFRPKTGLQEVINLPKALSDVQVLPSDDSSDDHDSHYEDIELFDANRKCSSPVSKNTVAYLDPQSYARSLEHCMPFDGDLVQGQSGVTDLTIPDWDVVFKVVLPQGSLLITENERVDLDAPDLVRDVTEQKTDENLENREDPLELFRETCLAYDKVGRVYYIPQKLLKKHGDPEGEPWFYPIEISSRQATLFLSQEKQEGCFLVYRSINKTVGGLFNLSVCLGTGDVVHYHVKENVHGDVMIEGHDHSFINIRDLVEYFQRNKSQLATRLRRPLKEAKLPITPGYHYKAKYEINRSALTLTGKIIGKGNFGVVCAGVYSNIPVAVKVLQKTDAPQQEEDDFIEEAKMMMSLKHEQVVRFIGLSCTCKPYFLITEYIPKGNLRDCLRNDLIANDNMDMLFDFCIQVTAAMFYLESQRYMLHRDLAGRNFLVTDDMCVKLADFGRARYVVDDHYQAPKTEKISIKWASPEVLLDSVYTTKSDVWALGVVFWEIFSGGERPYASLSGEQTAVYVTEGGRLDKPPGCPLDLYGMMKICWRNYPDERPSFALLYDKLKSKSSIYYSGPLRTTTVPSSSARSSGTSNRQSTPSEKPADPVKNIYSPPVKNAKGPTPTAKTRRAIVMEKMERMDDYGRDVLDREVSPEESVSQVVPSRISRERLATSTSELSLSSTGMGDLGRDDLTRGDKIRKSLRKIIHIKPRRKTTRVENYKFSTYGQDISS